MEKMSYARIYGFMVFLLICHNIDTGLPEWKPRMEVLLRISACRIRKNRIGRKLCRNVM